MALLHLALEWRPAGDFLALTVDHGLRPEAAEEARAVAAQCAELGVLHQTLNWTPPSRHISQARARDGRHRLLAEALRVRGGRHLLLGHTLDDQYETVEMRSQRGEVGLAGMRALAVSPVWPEGRNIFLARPLLDHRRADLRDFLMRRAVRWTDDPSNENRDFERVRVRHALAGEEADKPATDLDRVYRRALEERQHRDADLAGWLGTHVEAFEDGLIICDPASLDVDAFAEGLSYLLLAASGSDSPASRKGRVQLARDILKDRKNWRSRTLGGAWLAPRQGRVHIARDPGQVPSLPDPNMFGPKSDPIIWDGRFEMAHCGLSAHPDAGPVAGIEVSALARAGFPVFENAHILARCLVAERLHGVKGMLGHENCVFAC